ncbi:ABC transporter permease, partial [Streptomyces sp. 2MCAF27]
GYLAQQPWAPLIPGAAIMITVGALNILADAIRDSDTAMATTAATPTTPTVRARAKEAGHVPTS